jgi:hypothetical protein
MRLNRIGVFSMMIAVVAIGILAANRGGSTMAASPAPISEGSVPPPNVSLPPGEWTAIGKDRETRNVADARAGTTEVRPWTFKHVCANTCRTVFLRQTLYGPSATVLVDHHGIYIARFPPVRVPCAHYPRENAGTALSFDTYTLRWSANRQQLVGVSRSRGVGQCPGEITTSWRATRNVPTAPGP